MKALVFDIRINSLYSIRIPFTWQSALTYPVLPPSAVIGMLANALQRFKSEKRPNMYLYELELQIEWAGSRLLSPCVIKSYTTSAIVKWEDILGGKFTNALGRQYAFCKKLQILAIFKSDLIICDIVEALKTSPLTCGDSESPISIDSKIMTKDVDIDIEKDYVQTEYPVPFTKDSKIEGNGWVYLMHERCKKKGDNFPLVSYMVPIREERKILKPSYLKVWVTNERIFNIDEIGYVLARPPTEEIKEDKLRKKEIKKK